MHSITTLRTELGLTTTNQVRNRIEAIKDLLREQIRRGPNNQILLTDEGLELLRRLQELYDSGLTISEASGVMRVDRVGKKENDLEVSRRSVPFETKPVEAADATSHIREEIVRLHRSIASLEAIVRTRPTSPAPSSEPWWMALREEIDAP
ncbi:hypothetical protein ACFLSF_03550 [Candidatus Bipolaricaulota bacterium]